MIMLVLVVPYLSPVALDLELDVVVAALPVL